MRILIQTFCLLILLTLPSVVVAQAHTISILTPQKSYVNNVLGSDPLNFSPGDTLKSEIGIKVTNDSAQVLYVRVVGALLDDSNPPVAKAEYVPDIVTLDPSESHTFTLAASKLEYTTPDPGADQEYNAKYIIQVATGITFAPAEVISTQIHNDQFLQAQGQGGGPS